MAFEKLLEPLRLNDDVTLKNRIVKAPQATMFWNEDGTVSARGIAAYEAIARGGAGMIVVGGVAWQQPPEGVVYCCAHDDRFILGLRDLAEAVQRHGCKIVAQVNHLGPSARATVDGKPPMGPSALSEAELPSPYPHLMPGRALDTAEMEEHRVSYIDACRRLEEAGWDGVEVHCANGYYFASFLTDIWNKRSDEYGTQTIENRTRYVREVIDGVKKAVGDSFVVGVRMNGQEWGAEGRLTPDVAARIAAKLAETGIDYLSVNGYGYGPNPFKYCPDYFPYPEPEDFMKPFMDEYAGDGINMAGVVAIKRAVDIPVIAAGRLDERSGEAALEAGKADLIAFGRALYADPELPVKLAAGRLDDIRHCTRCATCEDPLTEPRCCRVNPAMGRELELEPQPAAVKKRVLVAGGGPAGLEAARVAAERGHDVTLCERADRLGGAVELASMIKGNQVEDLMPLVDFLVGQIGKSAVKVRLKTEVTPQLAATEQPDAIIVATGAPYRIPDVPGIEGKNVFTVPALKKLAALPLKLLGPEKLAAMSEKVLPVGRRLVILGGGAEGVQCAVFMRKRGKEVTLLTEGATLGGAIPEKLACRIFPWFEERGVEVYERVTYRAVEKKGVRVALADGTERFFTCDSVLVMEPQVPDAHLAHELEAVCDEVHLIGSVRGGDNAFLKDALLDGRRAACEL